MIVAGPLAAQETLAWKLTPGTHFFLERVYHQKQVVDVKNSNFKQESKSTWLSKLTALKAGADEVALEQTIVSVKFDRSGKAAAVAGGLEAKFADKLKGAKFRVTLTPAGKVRKFEGYDDAVRTLADKDDAQEKALRFLVPESALREGLEEVLGFLPAGPVKVGDTWQREASEPVPPFGSFRTDFRYTYRGRQDDTATLDYTVQMSYRPPAKDAGLFRVVKGELKADGGKGQVLFDARLGRLIRGEKQVAVRGTLTVEAAGNQSELTFVSENRLEWRLLESAPK
jgi:hypothetical protein